MAEVVDLPQSTAEVTEAQKPEVFNADELQIGYLVGLDPEGNFVFRVFGKSQGLVELMGVHAHACRRVQSIHDAKQGIGDGLVLEVLRQVQALGAAVEKVSSVVAPKRPDNKL